MTGVVVSTDDSCCWPGGGSVDSPHFEVVALIPPGDFLRWWNDQHTGDDTEPMTDPDDWRASSIGIKVPVEDIVTDADPGDEPLSARITEGRWRVAYDGDPVMVCVGSRGYEYEWVYTNGFGHSERVGDTEYLRLRCGMVDMPSPVRVTVSVHFGGIGVRTA